ncbi:unnamed protein product [Rotaria socialis]|uniref:Uncharacterized protein n=1 Tax=Rotaria socialis TaxID=392032 RepID=A0A820W1T1_9BILA|nr:unnamed protein product [Rotaria socialis]
MTCPPLTLARKDHLYLFNNRHSRAACPTISIAERMVQQKYRRMIGSTKIQSNNLLKNKVGRAIHPTVTISEPLGAVYEMV